MPILKSIISDFRVSESMAVAVSDPGPDTYHYLRLHKSGRTTFEAVDAVAEVCGIARADIGYAGLKDEDGVTDQFLTVAGQVPADRIEAFNTAHGHGSAPGSSVMRLRHHGHGEHPLHPGELDGNSFRVVARGLTREQAERLGACRGRQTFHFVNYYDTQRFGVPDGPKQTHLLGRALLAGDYPRALELLRDSGSPEGRLCADFEGEPEAFFAGLDQRRIAFYLSSHASDEWNAQVRALVAGSAAGDLVEEVRDGIPYVFVRRPGAALEVLRRGAALRCRSYRWRDGAMVESESARPPVVQTQLRVGEVGPDELAAGAEAWRCTLSFFLPSGAYATTAITQFFHALPEPV
ncbi:tRNA pseudouridine(13) synthase TruD [Kitasatospora sp. NBC_01266]|uniref:tRNA pseudouridine(13) synthase TruD n=1 Tax=Kitasatospora sp. NBC_01266 TaxID=2903572 RepID=UPI002E373907|nr:tRNA pseudouridine(13) synthase TruD [Kitasatospora sp. NBC_01266]